MAKKVKLYIPKDDGIILLSIHLGELRLKSSDKFLCAFPANAIGAKEMGTFLQRRGYTNWLFSSSVDYPTEHGGTNIDFHKKVEDSFTKSCQDASLSFWVDNN